MQCQIELFSLAHWQQFLYITLGIIYVLFLLEALIAQVWCSTGAMAHYADVYAVDIKKTCNFSFF